MTRRRTNNNNQRQQVQRTRPATARPRGNNSNQPPSTLVQSHLVTVPAMINGAFNQSEDKETWSTTLTMTSLVEHQPAMMPHWHLVRVTTLSGVPMLYTPPAIAGRSSRPQLGNTFTTAWIDRATYLPMTHWATRKPGEGEIPIYTVEYHGPVQAPGTA